MLGTIHPPLSRSPRLYTRRAFCRAKLGGVLYTRRAECGGHDIATTQKKEPKTDSFLKIISDYFSGAEPSSTVSSVFSVLSVVSSTGVFSVFSSTFSAGSTCASGAASTPQFSSYPLSRRWNFS